MELQKARPISGPKQRPPFSHRLRNGSAWLLCLSFFFMIPIEFASLEWKQTTEGLWRIESGENTGVWFTLSWFLWALITLAGILGFTVGGLISRFAYERKRNRGVEGRDIAYYFAWIQLLTLVVTLPYYALNPEEGNSWIDYFPHILMLGIAVFLFRGRLSDLGLRLPSVKNTLALLASVAISYVVVYFFLDPLVTEPVARFFHLELNSWREDSISKGIDNALKAGWVAVFGQMALIGIIGPIAEEVVFRGLLMNALMKRGWVVLSIVLSSLVFALFHADITFLAPLFILGMILGTLYAVFRNLWAPILFHIVNNTASVILDILHK
ncbi:CPBP family intramembrane glutamic endopeptidase [Salinithrix halophila]|uniref:CPBP family intramembrane glutamic endopeptidase n=1 Tax=Salinithrix halophila TaxID=1485204 RepID=A0ABV8JF46_9BACL